MGAVPPAANGGDLRGIQVASAADGYGHLVVDGQQRLASIATAALSGRFWLDLDAGTLVTSAGPWRIPAAYIIDREKHDAFDWPEPHAAEHGLRATHVRDAWMTMEGIISRVYISAIRLGTDWSLDRVVETFRRINTEGTPMSPEDLRHGLERARGHA